MSEGVITSIKEVTGVSVKPSTPTAESAVQLGLGGMIAVLTGTGGMDGYEVTTSLHTYRVLISNGQDCCENWGYFSSDDDLTAFLGAELLDVRLTDVNLKNASAILDSDSGYKETQFVDFVTSMGTFQLAVYNEHEGYYGHGILVLRDDVVLLDTYI